MTTKTYHSACDCAAVDNGVGVQHEPHCATHITVEELVDRMRGAEEEVVRLREHVVRMDADAATFKATITDANTHATMFEAEVWDAVAGHEGGPPAGVPFFDALRERVRGYAAAINTRQEEIERLRARVDELLKHNTDLTLELRETRELYRSARHTLTSVEKEREHFRDGATELGTKLEFALRYVPSSTGKFTFPDGDTYDAGPIVDVVVTALAHAEVDELKAAFARHPTLAAKVLRALGRD